MKFIIPYLFSLIFCSLNAQINTSFYQFTPIYDIETSTIKSQGRTGTCWSFSTSSFLENEVKRITGKSVDLSEMYSVRKNYENKAFNYLYRQGKAQLSQGGLSHDVINSIKQYGLVPEAVFSGYKINNVYNHKGLDIEIKQLADSVLVDSEKYSPSHFEKDLQTLLDTRIGKDITNFEILGKQYTPHSYAKSLKIKPSEYVTLTSYTHVPFYDYFILSIPDNYSNGSYYNLPLDEYVSQVKHALSKGYSVAIDSDVSEKTWSTKLGLAIVLIDEDILDEESIFTKRHKEPFITQEKREEAFLDFSTTDDHLMHIVGLVKDKEGISYFKIKNSWGEKAGNNGYFYMSEAYFRLKSIAVTLSKKALKKRYKTI